MRKFEEKLRVASASLFACFAFACSASLKAQTLVSAPAAAGAAPAVASGSISGASTAFPAAAPAVFHVLGLPITNSMICTWIVAGIILLIVRATTSGNIKEIPSGMQNILEALVEMWDNLIGDILDKRVTRWVFPFATTFFIFIVIANLTELVPGIGSIGTYSQGGANFTPLFRAPTTDANLTVAMAGIFLVMSLYWAVRYHGFFGLIKHIFGVKVEANRWLYPLYLLLFIFIGAMELLSVAFARPVALAMRLYGNIFAGDDILDMIFHAKSLVATIALSTGFYFYEGFVCLVQAFVFAMLVVAFVGTLCTNTTEQHGH